MFIREFKSRVRLMGILNLTPDSFSDGGEFVDSSRAVDHALKMVDEGAAVIDIGAESTRPGSVGVTADEQLARILPVLTRLRAQSKVKISIDTQNSRVAEACLDEGADVINDVSALRADANMVRVLKHRNNKIIMMHMQGTPATMQQNPVYDNVVQEIVAFFKERIEWCERAGISRDRLWLDPGVGFGKLTRHNIEIIRDFGEFVKLGLPCVGAISRKGFLGELTGEKDPRKRDAASAIAAMELVWAGATILRVHDVKGHAAALNVFDALN